MTNHHPKWSFPAGRCPAGPFLSNDDTRPSTTPPTALKFICRVWSRFLPAAGSVEHEPTTADAGVPVANDSAAGV